jgi:hypothetical protein
MVAENLVLVAVFFLVLIVLSRLFTKMMRLLPGEVNSYRLMMIFPNLGFMGIPLVRSLYGEEANKLAALAEVDKFAAAIDAEASTTGSLDRPAAPTDTPASNEVVRAEIAALPETEEPFQVPQKVAPAPEVAPHIEASAPVANQEITPAPVEAPVTVDAIADATAAPESDAMWKQFDAGQEASTTVASAPVEAVPAPVETPEQNQ